MAVIRQRAPMYSEGFDTQRHTMTRYSIKKHEVVHKSQQMPCGQCAAGGLRSEVALCRRVRHVSKLYDVHSTKLAKIQRATSVLSARSVCAKVTSL